MDYDIRVTEEEIVEKIAAEELALKNKQKHLDDYAREKIHAYACALVAAGKINYTKNIFEEACRLFVLIDTLYTNEIQESDE